MTPSSSSAKRVPKAVSINALFEESLRFLEDIERSLEHAKPKNDPDLDDLLALAHWSSNACRVGLCGAGLDLEEAQMLHDGLAWLWLQLHRPVPDNQLHLGSDGQKPVNA